MQAGARIGKYEIEQFLGGGMSHVFRARDTVIGRTVAIKILTDQGCMDKDTKARFLFEAQTSGNIVHENIIHIYDYGEEQGRPFMVMEFLVGQDLKDAIKNGQTGDLANKIRIALQISRALEYVHSKGIIHRDIKPENVHLDGSGKVRLMDFGIAKAHGLSMTKTGFALGTPYYMAPEQVRGEKVNELADVYAFGILMFELFAGAKPITGDTLERLFYAIMNEPINLEPLKQAGVPEQLRNVIARCTAKKAADRYPTMAAVSAELEEALKRETPAVAPPPGQRQSGKKVAAIVVALLLVVTAFSVWYAWPRPKPPLDKVVMTDTGRMLLIPAGRFLYGKDKVSEFLPDYYIDETEVTIGAFRKYLRAKGATPPPDFPAEGRDSEPVANVTFDEAQSFARWASKRLPNAMEWEKAARGTDGRLYTWGDDPDPSKANVADNKAAGATLLDVGSMRRGASPFQVLDMIGNVWEWVDASAVPSAAAIDHYSRDSKYDKAMNPPPTRSESWFTIRGGSYRLDLKDCVADDAAAAPARFRAPDLGFRCVKSVPR